ncbi:MAG: VWA domain-containing protein [Pseudomonadota bacterium]
MTQSLPRSLDPFLAFPAALRQAGFAAAPEQTQGFIAATGLLGPTSLADIRHAATALYGPAPERQAAFDEVFDSVFLGRAFAAPADGAPQDLPEAYDAAKFELMPEESEEEPSGAEATATERLTARALDGTAEDAALRAFARAAPAALPRRRSRRLRQGRGRLADPARAFRQMLRHDGELTTLPTRQRRLRQRRVLLLVDVSGSMKAGTEGTLRFAHALMQAGERVEAFTLGTRLTRVTRALRHRSREQALTRASGLVADWDGGTRLGEALSVFLSIPRFAAFARGAMVVIVSDGLERGGPDALIGAMTRLENLAWSILWLSPLAAEQGYRPETGALTAIAPRIDRFGDGRSPASMAREVLSYARGARP